MTISKFRGKGQILRLSLYGPR